MHTEYLFVYGTLRKLSAPSMHQRLARSCVFISEGSVRGHLYEVDGYPGTIEAAHEEARVYGEIYAIHPPNILLAELDAYEECSEEFPKPHEYIRKKLPVVLPTGDRVSAWVYLYNRDTSRLERIDSGDYSRR